VPSRGMMTLASLALAVALVALPAGCGSASNVPTTVQGLVQFQGYPLVGGLIVFTPDADRGGRGQPARADVQPDGSFQLQIEGSRQIPPGWYRVAIADPPTLPGRQPIHTGFPSRLRRPDRSDLLRQVQAGKDNHFEFLIEALNSAEH